MVVQASSYRVYTTIVDVYEWQNSVASHSTSLHKHDFNHNVTLRIPKIYFTWNLNQVFLIYLCKLDFYTAKGIYFISNRLSQARSLSDWGIRSTAWYVSTVIVPHYFIVVTEWSDCATIQLISLLVQWASWSCELKGMRRLCTFGLEWATVKVLLYFPYSSPSPLCSKFTSSKGYSKKSSEPTYNFCSRLGVSTQLQYDVPRPRSSRINVGTCPFVSAGRQPRSMESPPVLWSPFLSTQLVLDWINAELKSRTGTTDPFQTSPLRLTAWQTASFPSLNGARWSSVASGHAGPAWRQKWNASQTLNKSKNVNGTFAKRKYRSFS